MKHTPGPWTCNCDTKYAQPVISVGWHVRIADGSSIAVVLGEKNPELQANAKLITAAPDLLEALESVHRVLRKSGHNMELIDAVIAKAKGGTP